MIDLIVKIWAMWGLVFLWGLAWTTAEDYEERKYRAAINAKESK